MNTNLRNSIINVLDKIEQSGGAGFSVSNYNAFADQMIDFGTRVCPISKGSTIYVVQKALIPCDKCEQRGVGIGCCTEPCTSATYKVYTVIVNDVSSFCTLTPDGEIVLKKNVYLNSQEAYNELLKLNPNLAGLQPSSKKTILDLDEDPITVLITNKVDLKMAIDFLYSVGITQYGANGESNVLNLYMRDAHLFLREGTSLVINNLSRRNGFEPYVSIGLSYPYEHYYKFDDFFWGTKEEACNGN